MLPEDIDQLHEKVLANTLLTTAVGSGAKTLDTFGSWLLAGFGGVLALLISNVDALSERVPISAIECAAILFLVAAVAGVVQKYIATVLIAGAEAASGGRCIGEKLAEVDLDLEWIAKEVQRPLVPLARWILRRSFAKAASGDLSASGRAMTVWVQVQGALVLLESIMVLGAAARIVLGLVA